MSSIETVQLYEEKNANIPRRWVYIRIIPYHHYDIAFVAQTFSFNSESYANLSVEEPNYTLLSDIGKV